MRSFSLALAVVSSVQMLLCQSGTVQPKPAPVRRPAKPATTAAKAPAAPPRPMTDEEKTIYAIGLSIARSRSPLDLSTDELEILKRALSDAAAGKPTVKLEEWGPRIQPLTQSRSSRAADKQKAASRAYLEKAAAEPGAIKTDSGLIYRE